MSYKMTENKKFPPLHIFQSNKYLVFQPSPSLASPLQNAQLKNVLGCV